MSGASEFYQMIGATAATLIGLLFVSMSLNAETILGDDHKHARRLAEQAFQNYLAVLFVSLMDFFPHIGSVAFGQTLICAAAIWGSWTITRFFQVVRAPPAGYSLVRALRRYIPPLIGFAMLFVVGLETAFQKRDESTTCAIAILLLLLSATIVSWELLVQIAAEKYTSRDTPR